MNAIAAVVAVVDPLGADVITVSGGVVSGGRGADTATVRRAIDERPCASVTVSRTSLAPGSANATRTTRPLPMLDSRAGLPAVPRSAHAYVQGVAGHEEPLASKVTCSPVCGEAGAYVKLAPGGAGSGGGATVGSGDGDGSGVGPGRSVGPGSGVGPETLAAALGGGLEATYSSWRRLNLWRRPPPSRTR